MPPVSGWHADGAGAQELDQLAPDQARPPDYREHRRQAANFAHMPRRDWLAVQDACREGCEPRLLLAEARLLLRVLHAPSVARFEVLHIRTDGWAATAKSGPLHTLYGDAARAVSPMPSSLRNAWVIAQRKRANSWYCSS